MVSIQQLDFEAFDNSSDSIAEDVVVSIHRRSWTLLTYSKINRRFDFIQHDELGNCKWNIHHSWVVPDNIVSVVNVLPLESYDCFVFSTIGISQTWLILVNLNGQVMNVHETVNVSRPVTIEVDQQKRELFIGLQSAKILCYYIHAKAADARSHLYDANKKNLSATNLPTVIHITLRRQVKIEGTEADHDSKVPVQICSVDLLGFCLVLTKGGNIICFNSSRFDVLFELSKDLFALKPYRIWCDKFGADIVIQTKHPKNSKEKLEYWTFPKDFASCEAGQFNRVALPIHGQLLGLSIETVGVNGASTFITTVTTEQKVQLWRPSGDGAVLVESELGMIVPDALLHSVNNSAATLYMCNDDFFLGLRQQRGVFCFMRESQKLPDSQLLFVASICATIAKFCIHLPGQLDNDYAEVYNIIAVDQLQTQRAGLGEGGGGGRKAGTGNRLEWKDMFPSKPPPRPQQQQQQIPPAESVSLLSSRDKINPKLIYHPIPQSLSLNDSILSASGSIPPSHKGVSAHESMSLLLGSDDGQGGAAATAASPPKAILENSVEESSKMSIGEALLQHSMIDIDDVIESRLQSRQQTGLKDLPAAAGSSVAGSILEESASPAPPLAPSPLELLEGERSVQPAFSLIMPTESQTVIDAQTISKIGGAGSSNNSHELALPQSAWRDDTTVKSAAEPTSPGMLSRTSSLGSPGSHIVKNLMSVDSSGSHYDPLSPSHSFRLDQETQGVSSSQPQQFVSTVLDVTPEAFFFVPQQYVLNTVSTHIPGRVRSKPREAVLFQLISPFGMLIQHRGNDAEPTMQVVSRHGLRDASHWHGGHQFQELNFKLTSTAFRAGLFVVVTDLKEICSFSLKTPPERMVHPVEVEFEIRQNASVNAVLNADILLQHPPKPLTVVSKSSKAAAGGSKKNAIPVKEEHDLVGVSSLLLVGDSDGRLHYCILSEGAVCGYGVLRAHDAPVVAVLVTGDAVRPLWKVGTERSIECDHIVPTAIPGSGIITISKEGEVKTWQPVFRTKAKTGRSTIEKAFITYSCEWRLSGIFIAKPSPPVSVPSSSRSGLPLAARKNSVLTHASANSDVSGVTEKKSETYPYHPDGDRKIKGIESACLDPTCMNLLLGYKNGFLEEWPIPGLIEVPSGGLATTQSPAWVNASHFDGVVSMKVYIHAESTCMHEVDVRKENDNRDDVIAELSAYVKGSVTKTVGYTYKQLKLLTTNSSLVTSSKDFSIIVWGFSISRSFSESSSTFLIPAACRRLNFSSVPSHGLCYCSVQVMPNSSASFVNSMVWKVNVIVGGIVVTAFTETRSALFGQDPTIGTERSSAGQVFSSVDDFFDDDRSGIRSLGDGGEGGNNTESRGKKKCLPAISAMCQVTRAAEIVNPISTHVLKRENPVPSWKVLDQWSMVNFEFKQMVVHYDGDEEEPPANIVRPITYGSEKLSKTINQSSSVEQAKPSVKKIEFPEGYAGESQGGHPKVEVNSEGLRRFDYVGLHLVSTVLSSEADIIARDNELKESRQSPDKHLSMNSLGVPSDRRSPSFLVLGSRSADDQDKPGELKKGTSFKVVDMSQFASMFNDSSLIGTTATAAEPSTFTSPPTSPPHSPSLTAAHLAASAASAASAIADLPHDTLSSPLPTTPLRPGDKLLTPNSSHFTSDPLHSLVHTPSEASHKPTSISVSSVSYSKDSRVMRVVAVDHHSHHGDHPWYEEDHRQHQRHIASIDDYDRELNLKSAPMDETASLVSQLTMSETLSQEDGHSGGHHDTANAAVLRGQNNHVIRQTIQQVSRRPTNMTTGNTSSSPQFRSRLMSVSGPVDGLGGGVGMGNLPGQIPILQRRVTIKKEAELAPPPMVKGRPRSSSMASNLVKKFTEGDVMSDEALSDDIELDNELNTGRGPNPNHQLMRQKSYSLDVPDKREADSARRKTMLQNLIAKVGADTDLSVATSDVSSEVSNYFDRNAPPIYMKREQKPKKRLMSKRFDKPEVAAAAAKAAKKEEEPFDPFAAGFSPEEIAMFESLSEEEKAKMVAELRRNSTAVTKSGKNKNKALFNSLMAKKQKEDKEKAQLNMDIKLDLTDATDKSVTFTVYSISGGHVILAIVPQAPFNKPPPDAMHDRASIQEIQGLLAHECRDVDPQSQIEVTFADLKPSRQYIVYAIIDRSMAGDVHIDDEAKDVVSLEVFTSTEKLEIEWNRLDAEMMKVEIQAACRCKVVLHAAKHHQPYPVAIPDDAEMDTSPAAMEAFFANPQNTVWHQFLTWYLGVSTNSPTRYRADFLFFEALFAARTPKFTKRYVDMKICGAAEMALLSKFVEETFLLLATNKVRNDQIIESREFKKFRSWYKGGQVIAEFEEQEQTKRVRSAQRRMSQATAATSGMSTVANTTTMEGLEHTGTPGALALSMLQERTKFLTGRIEEVDKCRQQIQKVVEGHRYAIMHGLKEDDLLMRRGELSPHDITSIMCSLKLNQLCINNGLVTKENGIHHVSRDAFGKDPFNFAAIGAFDVFKPVLPDTLKPDDPPAVDMAYLPGTTRRPIKPWQLCSKEEQQLELTLACCLDAVIEVAINAGIVVPEPEDALLLHGQFPIREKRWKDFAEWYPGDEAINVIPGKGIPTLQRTLFAETTETKNVEQDQLVLKSMIAGNVQVPDSLKATLDTGNNGTTASAAAAAAAGMSGGEEGEGDAAGDSLMKVYSQAVATVAGAFVRFDLILRNINTVLTCRRLTMLRLIWPPGPNRLGAQIMFPRMGWITPRFELPARRIKLFPSRMPDAWTHKEILEFYSERDLESDDYLMRKAEVDGIKLRAYYEWLSHEKERVEENRIMMTGEDERGLIWRETTKLVEDQLWQHAKQLNEAAEVLGGEPGHEDETTTEDFKFMHSVPKEYWYIFEESCEFMHGSGVNNGDEIEELRQLEQERAKKAMEDAINFELYLQEEKNRRDNLEAERLKKEETERRLEEGVARRRYLREHFEDVKRQRVRDAQELLHKAEEEKKEALLLKQNEERLLARQRKIDEEKARWAHENACMQAEELYARDLSKRIVETQLMEHEDIASFVREQMEIRRQEAMAKKLEELKTLYVPFEPYEFKHSLVKKPTLHAILNTEKPADLDPFYLEKQDERSVHSHASNVSSHSGNTVSSHNRRSKRYRDLYEGSRPHKTQFHTTSTGSAGIAAAGASEKESSLSPTPQAEAPFYWKRVEDGYKHVRPVSNSPTKKDIRTNNSLVTAHIQKTYGSEWALQRDITPPCFVLTSKEKIRPLSGGTNTRRSLPALAPVLEPLRDTSIFVHPQKTGSGGAAGAGFPQSSVDLESSIESFVPFTSSQQLQQTVQPFSYSDSHPLTPPHGGSILQAPPRQVGSRDPSMPIVFNDSATFDEEYEMAQIQRSLPSNSSSKQLSIVTDPPSVASTGSKGAGNEGAAANKPVKKGSVHSADSRFSLFRSMSDNLMVDFDYDGELVNSWAPKAETEGHKKRKEMKDLLSISQEAITTSNENKWLEFQRNQQRLMFASLTSIEAKAEATKKEKKTSAMPLEELRELKRKGAEVAKVKQELKQLGIVEEAGLDFRTKKMAKSASDSVMKLKMQKDLLKNYVSSEAVIHDQFYLMACEPGIREKTSLETSEDVQRFISREPMPGLVKDVNSVVALAGQKPLERQLTAPRIGLLSARAPPAPDTLAMSSSMPLLLDPFASAVSSVSDNTSVARLNAKVRENPIGAILGNSMPVVKLPPAVKTKGKNKMPAMPVSKAQQERRQSKTIDLVIKTPTSSRLLTDELSIGSKSDTAFIDDALIGSYGNMLQDST